MAKYNYKLCKNSCHEESSRETTLFEEKAMVCSYSESIKKQNTRGTFLIFELHQAQFQNSRMEQDWAPDVVTSTQINKQGCNTF